MNNDNDAIDYTHSEETGAIPALHEHAGEVLGVPGTRAKSKTNVGKLAIFGIVLAGFLFIVAGLLFWQKHHRKAPVEAAADTTQATPPKYAEKNVEVESDSIDKTKAAIKKQEDEDAARIKAVADAQAAAQKAAADSAAKNTSAAPQGIGPASGMSGQAGPPAMRPMTPEERKMASGVLLDITGSKPASGGSGGPQLSEKDAQDREVAARMAALGRRPDGSLMTASGAGGGGGFSPAGLAGGGGGSSSESLAARLQPTVLQARSAGRLPNLTYLLKKGTTIPCALQTGIDTTLPGFVICSVMSDVYSANGKTLLIERGATVFGEQQSSLKQGQERTFVIWTRIDNPDGVFANIDSPATDQMGYSGIPGYVDTHFWSRFGGAIMLSLIKDFSAAYAQRMANTNTGSTTVQQPPYEYTQQTAQDMAGEALRNSINIPPTLVVNPATIVNVLVARDVSFENVFDVIE